MAEIKKISTELQLLDKFLDTSGDAGTSGQVLTSTGTGINWVSGGSLPGGPYLPLAGGTMTGNLNINTSTNFPLLLTGTNTNYTAIGIRNTGSGDAGIYMDGINGDFSGSDYAFIGQNDGGYLLYDIGVNSPLPYHVFTGGNVGIGTTNPAQDFVVADATSGNGIELVPGSTATIQTYNRGSSSYNNLNLDVARLLVRSFDYTTINTGSALTERMRWLADGQFWIKLNSTTSGREAAMSNDEDKLRIFGSRHGGTGKYVSIWSDGANENARFYPTKTVFYQNVGIGTTSPNHKLDIYSNENVPLRIHRPNNANLDSDGAWGIGFSTRGDAVTSTTDTRSGIFSYYNGNLFLATNNTRIDQDPFDYARLTILSGGNVGIGTTSPGQKLDVSGNIASNSIYLYDSTSNDRLVLDLDASDNLQIATGTSTGSRGITFFTENSEKMRILSGGNVGIGTASPSARLDVIGVVLGELFRVSNTDADATTKYGTFMGRHYTNSEENITGMLLTSSSSVTGGAVSIGGGITSANAVNEIKFYTAANNTTLTGSERMRITPSGNVGIGTTSPGAKLEIVGDSITRSKTRGLGTNYATSEGWVAGAAGSFTSRVGYFGGNFTINGASAENKVEYDIGPFGSRELVWMTVPETGNNDDGGWNKALDGFNNSANNGFISIVYVRRDAGTAAGNFYHGCSGSNTLNLDGTTNTNPYFSATGISILPADVWCAAIGIIHATNDTTTTTSALGGIYRLDTGEKIQNSPTFRQKTSNVAQSQRVYHFYSTSTTAQLDFANPGWYILDGSEPSLGEILGSGSADDAFWSANGNDIYNDNSGNVGIGTDSPDAKLVVRTSTDHNFEVEETGGELRLSALNDARSANIGLQFAASEFNFITGNVGIGENNPSSLLHLKKAIGDPMINIQAVASGDPGITFTSINNRTGNIFYSDGTTNAMLRYDHADVSFKLYAHNTTVADFVLNETTAYFPTQNVGIGTTSPSNKLHVVDGNNYAKLGDLHGDSTMSLRMADNSGFPVEVQAYGTELRFNTATTTGATPSVKMNILPNGNVGIGTTSPSEKLSLPDNAKIGLGSSADLQIYHNATNSVISNSTGHLYIKTTVADKDIIFEASNGAGSVESYLEIDSDQQDIKVNKRIEMTGTGSAGGQHTIEFNPGTSAIGYIYHDDTNFNVRAIKASSDLVLEATHGNVQILNGNGSGTEVGVMIEQYIAHIGDTDTKFGFTAANQFQVIAGGNTNLNVQGNGVDLSYAGSTRLTTQTGGIAITGDLTVTAEVGIGLTNPDVPLHVTANEDGSGIDKGAAKFINTNTGQGATTMHMVQTSSSNFANAVKFWQGSTPTAVGFIRLTTSATQFITSASDLNLKKNITNWSDDTLSKFKALEPKKFRFKTQDVSEDKTLGFIAQNEVDNFPEAYPQFLGDNEQPYYGFNPTGMVPHLMKAIKDLVEKVETLENRITQLENNN